MPLQYVTVPHRDLARGIDSRTRLNRLADGYSEDLVNVDTNAEGYLSKRKGYQGYGGWIPLRVISVVYGDSTHVHLQFDSSVNLTGLVVAATPIILFGKVASGSCDLFNQTNSYHYITNYTLTGTNTLVVPATSISLTFGDPQLTVWGITHEGHYNDGHSAPGHVTLLTTYKREEQETLLAALGGTLYAAEDSADAPFAFYTSLVSITNQPDANITLGPRFVATGYTSTRSDGYITADNVVGHGAVVSGAQWMGGSSVAYTLSLPNKVVTGSLSSIIYTVAGLEDYLTVTGMNYSALDGRFKILSVTEPDAASMVITVENAGIDSSVWDTASTAGIGNIFTDLALMSTTATFFSGDLVYGTDLDPAIDIWSVSQVLGGLISFDNITRDRTIHSINELTGRHTGTDFVMGSTSDLVLGDMLSHTSGAPDLHDSYVRQFRVVGISGGIVTLDESVSMSDGDTLHVPTRWIPVEIPISTQEGVITARPRLFDTNGFADQPRIRSAEVNSSLFMTNGSDEVFKFDGVSAYRAGMFPWQTISAVGVNKTAGALVAPSVVSTTGAKDAASQIPLAGDQAAAMFAAGSYVIDKAVPNILDLILAVPGASIIKTKPTSGFTAASEVLLAQRYKYYTRINIIDRNQNVVASALTQSRDVDVTPGNNTANKFVFRLSNVPISTDVYDWDRVEIQLYRTGAGLRGLAASAPFYLVGSYSSTLSRYGHYLFAEDSLPDTVVTNEGNLDDVSSALNNAELGTRWDQPQRSKYITSVSNYLVQAHTKSYGQLQITLKKDPNKATIGALPQKFHIVVAGGEDFTFSYQTSDTAFGSFNAQATNRWVVTANAGTDRLTATAPPMYLENGDRIWVESSGSMPAPLLPGTDYYVSGINQLTGAVFVSASRADALNSIHIDLTTNGSGTIAVVSKERVQLHDGTGFIGSGGNYAFTPGVGGGWALIDGSLMTSDTTLADYATRPNLQLVPIDTVPTANYATFVERSTISSFSGITVAVGTAPNTNDIPVYVRAPGLAINEIGDDIESDWAFQTAESINAVMTIRAQYANSSFRPSILAYAGGDYGLSTLVLKQPSTLDNDVSVYFEPDDFNYPVGNAKRIPDYTVYINGVQRGNESVSTETSIFPSRVLVSYANYPEIMDNPNSVDPGQSTSVVDVNSSDGQEITGLIPFLSQAAFGASQVNDIVVVFKTASIYLVKASTREITKIDSRGLGCTAPDSIAATQNAIFFANESGLYKLNRDLTVSYIEGKWMEGKWTKVNKDALASCYAYADPLNRAYKLSVPVGEDATNSQVYMYDYTRETSATIAAGAGAGAWTTYDNHPATYWTTTISGDSYFGTTSGQVFIRRNLGENSDYRDDADAVSEMLVRYKAVDFGEGGARKVVAAVVTDFDFSERADMSGTIIETAVDLTTNFEEAATVAIQFDPTNLSDKNVRRVQTLRATPPRRRCIQMQVQYRNSVKDEPVVLAGITFVVAGLPARKGITEAGSTSGAFA